MVDAVWGALGIVLPIVLYVATLVVVCYEVICGVFVVINVFAPFDKNESGPIRRWIFGAEIWFRTKVGVWFNWKIGAKKPRVN